MTWVPEILDVQLEITSRCNALCPGCSRQMNPGEINPYFEVNRDVPLELIRNFLDQPETRGLKSILFNGNYGDPAAHPEFIDILREIVQARPQACIVVHTNGGLRAPNFWQELATIIRGKGKWVKFSIDGLEDTHPIYRRNVVWTKVMSNVETFIGAGGSAVWKWVDFGHTRHQLEEARELSRRMGFVKFEVRRENTGIGDYTKPLPHRSSDLGAIQAMSDGALDEFNRLWLAERDLSTLACMAKRERSVFVDYKGRLWPCTWTANLPYSRWLEMREHFLRRELRDVPESFNDLALRPIREILEHPWFKSDLESGWSSEGKCLSTCALSCAQRKAPDHSLV